MTAYTYKAMNAQGRQMQGVMEGDSERQIRHALREQQLFVLSVDKVAEQRKNKQPRWFDQRYRMNTNDLSLFTRQLATLLSAGLPIEEALSATAEQTEKPKIKNMLLAVRSRVLEGHALAMGLADFPAAFSQLYRATVGAGEQSGKLELVLEGLADYVESQQKTQQKVKQALIYPATVTFISLSIVIFLLVVVVPKMISVFTETQQALPWMTSFLITISDGLARYGLFVAILFIAGFSVFQYFLRKNLAFRTRVHQLALKLPIAGRAIRITNTARFSRTMGLLSSAGVPILDAMQAAASLVTNIPMQNAVKIAATRVGEGAQINRALKQTGYFSAMSIHLIASGEMSGQLEPLLARAAMQQEREVAHLVETLLALFEPCLILLMGSLVLFIVLAVLLPIFSLNQLAM